MAQSTRSISLSSYTPQLVACIFVATLTALFLSTAQYKQLSDEIISSDLGSHRPTTASLLAYTTLTPLLTAAFIPLSLLLALLAPLPVYTISTLITTPILLACWLIQTSVWLRCEIIPTPQLPAYPRAAELLTNPNAKLPNYCPQRNFIRSQSELKDSTSLFKIGTAGVVIGLYMVYVVVVVVNAMTRGREDAARADEEKEWDFRYELDVGDDKGRVTKWMVSLDGMEKRSE